MAKIIDIDELSSKQRLDLIGELWDSISDSDAISITPELAQELDRRIAASKSDPDRASDWSSVKERIINTYKSFSNDAKR